LVLVAAVSLLGAVTVPGAPPTARAAAGLPPESTFFSTTSLQESSTIQTASDGDLWASCWSDDGNLYAANGDGKGFSLNAAPSDVSVSRIAGGPTSLTGVTVAQGDAVGQVWTAGGYNRKPTGMVCVDGTLYLALQDLSTSFNDAPAATIVKSTDHGATWTWDRSAPMFSNHVFTTMFFADYGQDGANAPDGYVYVYGLDGNWRTSYDHTVADPVDLYLARVPKASIQSRSTWQFYSGLSGGSPTWTSDIGARASVLHDDTRVYGSMLGGGVGDLTRLAQGGVLYDKPLGRYLYSSWTEYTQELYESPTPYGPWSHFYTKDYGGYPWTQAKNGGYATTIPSKFLSADGRTAYLQSNVCPCGGGGTSVYDFALRKLTLTTAPAPAPTNPVDNTVNLAQQPGTTPIEHVAHFGNNTSYNDGDYTDSEDDWNNERKSTDASWWGYEWPQQYTMNQLMYTTGTMFPDGGWFASGLRVQVRHGGAWTDVTGTWSTPGYPFSAAAGSGASYIFTFAQTVGDGIRIIGTPGGAAAFTSIGELTVHNAGAYSVGGAILTEYNALGGASGLLGAAVTDETSTPNSPWGAGRYNHFQKDGSIYWSAATGAHEVHGAIHDKWASLGWEQGMGFPTTDELTAPDGVGRYNHFQGGSIYWTPATGAHAIQGVIRDKWASLGWEKSVLGYPVSDELNDPAGKRSNFQNGYIVFNASTGVATAYYSNGAPV
jgi:hypothetical protein